jgi:hypothetical protein
LTAQRSIGSFGKIRKKGERLAGETKVITEKHVQEREDHEQKY